MANQAVEEMRAAVNELRREIAKLEACIAEHDGRPAKAWFHRLIAGEVKGSARDAYLALRAEEIFHGMSPFKGESAEDQEEIDALVEAMRREHAAKEASHAA